MAQSFIPSSTASTSSRGAQRGRKKAERGQTLPACELGGRQGQHRSTQVDVAAEGREKTVFATSRRRPQRQLVDENV